MNSSVHAAGPPHTLFQHLREECPIKRVRSGQTEYWSITGDAEVVAVNRDACTFSSHRGGVFLNPDQIAPLDLLRNVPLFMDPPQHSTYRRILSSVFTPKSVNAMEAGIRDRVTRTIDAVIETGRCDFVSDIAVPIPLAVLAQLMGIPDDDIPILLEWTHKIERAQNSSESGGALDVFGEMVAYLHPLIQRQTEDAGDNLVKRLRDARVDGEGLTDEQILGFFSLLVFAGNDTTRNTAATGLLALLEHPDQWELLRDRPERIPTAVEEILRWTSVVKYFVRTATQAVDIGGRTIAEGDKVVMWFTSASRDAALNDRADEFDVMRTNPQHRAFGGGGPHFCLGNALARLELRLIYEQVARRMPDIRLDGAPTHLASNWVHGLTSMPVTFRPGPREATAGAQPAKFGE